MPELFPYRPLSPVAESLHWTTDLVEAFDGGESRRAVRAIPRQEWEWQVVVEDQRHLSLLRGQQTQAWYVPAWQEGVVTTAQITAGAGTIAVDTTTGEWRSRMIVWTSPTYCEVLTIASITDNEVTLTGTVSQTYATGATIAPVRLARCGSSLGIEEAPDHGRLFLLWLVMDAAALTDYDLPVQYGGLDVLMEPVLLDGDYLARELHTPLELLDYGTGIIEPIARYEASRWSVPEARLRLEGRTAAWNIKRWLYKLQGRFLGLYAGSRKRELTIAATFTAADVTLTIRRIDYALLEDTGVDDLLLFERHGSLAPIIRTVTGAAVVDATTETLTLDSPLWIAGGPTTFKNICWLYSYRLSADRIELSWEAADRLELRLPFGRPPARHRPA